MSIDTLFSAKAGRAERMLKRQYQNPLFGEPSIEPFDIQDARQQDMVEAGAFFEQFRSLVEQVSALPANAEADDVLKLKEALDKAYETSAGLAGDQAELQQMIQRLLGLMMQSMWKAVGNDAQGISKLEMEEQARQAHFTLLQHPLIADMLSPDSPIDEELLVPCLLSEPVEAAALAFQLFEPEQQALLYEQARQLLQDKDPAHPRIAHAQQSLQKMTELLKPLNQQPD